MAKKQLNILEDDTEINYSGTTPGAVMVPIDLIQTKPAFSQMYKIKPEDYTRIKKSVSENGFNQNHAISCWCFYENDEEQLVLLDGHTRLSVCKDLGLYEIPVHKYNFTTEKEALIWAYGEQLNRRQLSDSDLYASFEKIDDIQNPGRKKNSENDEKSVPVDSTAETAALLGTSKRQVSKLRNIQKNGDEETKAAVASGELSINQADKKINSKKQRAKKAEKTEKNEEALDDSTGNPSATFVHQRTDEHAPAFVVPEETEIDKWTVEKNKQIETARKESFAKGFETATYYILAEVKKGKTPEDVWSSFKSLSPSGMTDFSPSVIANFVLPEDSEEIVNQF